VLFAGLCACGRIGFSGSAAGDGGGGSDADPGGDPDAMPGDPTALACDVAFELLDIPEPKYWFGAGPFGVVVATKADGADTMEVTRFSQQGAVLNQAGQVELAIGAGLFQPFVTAVDGGWLVGATDNNQDARVVALTGGLSIRAQRDTPYAVWNLATRSDHAMAAVAVGLQLQAAELDALGNDMITPVDIEMPQWEEPFVGENQNAIIVIHSHAGGTASCNVTQEYDDDHVTVVEDYGMVGMPCQQLAIARNHTIGQSMAIEGRASGVVMTFVVPFDNTLATESSLRTGNYPLIVESGDHYAITWENAVGGLSAAGLSSTQTTLAAERTITPTFDDGRLDNMSRDVPVMIWLDGRTLFAERLCL
jgi:hypothetical protein